MSTNVSSITTNNTISKLNGANYGNTNVFTSAIANHPIQDTYTPSKQNSQGLSNKSKLLIALGGIALVGGALLYAMRGKFNKAVQLAEHIDFKPAKTVEEAAEFAKTHLGIKKFEVQGLEAANFINGALSEAVNKTKGKIILPAKLKSVIEAEGLTLASTTSKSLEFNINKNHIFELLKTDIQQRLKIANVNIEKLSLADIYGYANALKQNAGPYRKFDKYGAIFHELGHIQHRNAVGFKRYYELAKYTGEEAYKAIKHNTQLQKHFKTLDNIMQKRGLTAGHISRYGMFAPGEFVAEVYRHMLSGTKLPNEVMDLYKQYGGAMLS